jgi:hypothetical protein
MSQRFYVPEKFMRIRDDGKFLAFFGFIDNETGLEYRSFRLVQGQYGVFAGSPSHSYQKPGEPKPSYVDHVQPAYAPEEEKKQDLRGRAWFEEVAQVAHAVYQKIKSTGGGGGGGGRGPVPQTAAATEDDGLPF